MAETIREFLVSLGFKVDGGSEAKFSRSVEVATKGVIALGAAAVAASTAVTAAVTKIAAGFDELYYASQRTKASAENIKAIGYAVSQLGGSYQGAVASLEAFTQKLRSNPGYESLAKSIGVVTRENGRLRDTTALMTDIARTLDRKYSGDKRYIALQYLEALGIDEATYEALKSGDLARYTEEYRKKQEALGVTQSRAAEIGRDLTRAWRSLSATAAALGDKLLVSLGPGIKDFVDKLDAFLLRNSDRIVLFFEKVTQWVGELLKAFVQLVEKGEGPIVEMFDKIVVGVDKMKTAFEVLAVFLAGAFLVSVLGTFSKVGAGFVGMLLKLGINPLTVGVGGALALSTGSANGGEDQEIARRRAQGTWGNNGFDGTNPAPRDNRNWWQRTMPRFLGGRDAPAAQGNSSAPIAPGSFADKAPGIMKRLQEDFGLTREQAAGIMGNLGHESNGLKDLQEKNPTVPGSRGGYGWAQWTGPRRRAFEAWAAEKGLDPASDEANYGFLRHELRTTERAALEAIKRTDNVGDATRVFEQTYERAGIKHYGSRDRWAARALRAAQQAEASERTMRSIGFGAFDPSTLARTQANAAMGKGSFGLGGPILVPQANNATSVDMQQKTEITILGGSDPQATAQAVAGAQDKVNGGMIRNMQGAVR